MEKHLTTELKHILKSIKLPAADQTKMVEESITTVNYTCTLPPEEALKVLVLEGIRVDFLSSAGQLTQRRAKELIELRINAFSTAAPENTLQMVSRYKQQCLKMLAGLKS